MTKVTNKELMAQVAALKSELEAAKVAPAPKAQSLSVERVDDPQRGTMFALVVPGAWKPKLHKPGTWAQYAEGTPMVMAAIRAEIEAGRPLIAAPKKGKAAEKQSAAPVKRYTAEEIAAYQASKR